MMATNGSTHAGRWALALAAATAGALLWAVLVPAFGGGGADDLRVRSLTVIGEDGATVAVLRAGDAGGTLQLRSGRGEYEARLETGASGPELRFTGAEGQLRLGLGDVVRGGAGLSLYDPRDRLRLGLAYSRGTGTNLVLGDASGRVRAAVAVDTAGPYLGLLDAGGDPIWEAP